MRSQVTFIDATIARLTAQLRLLPWSVITHSSTAAVPSLMPEIVIEVGEAVVTPPVGACHVEAEPFHETCSRQN